MNWGQWLLVSILLSSFIPGIIMGTGQLLGATLGSHLVIRKGTKFIRFFFLAVVAITIAKLIYSTYIK